MIKVTSKQAAKCEEERVSKQAAGSEQPAASKRSEPIDCAGPRVSSCSRLDLELRPLEAGAQRPAEQGAAKTRKKLAASLLAAAAEGKVELVRLLLRCGADVNAQDEQFGTTALHQAAWNGFSETVQVLCKHRANTSIRNKAHFTPLHLACQQGHNQSARLLLMAGARSEARNSFGDTPLHTAARYGHAGVARILLSAKCNANQVNKNHDTPLHIAAAMGRRKLTKIFMQNGAEAAIKNKQNETPMDIALRKDLIDIQELIANPPPAQSKQHSRRPTAPIDQPDAYHAHRPRRHRPARRTRPARRSRPDESDDDDHHCDEQAANSDASLEPLEERFASRLRLSSHAHLPDADRYGRVWRASDRSGRRRSASRAGAARSSEELAVDVPDEFLAFAAATAATRNKQHHAQQLVSTHKQPAGRVPEWAGQASRLSAADAFASLNSLGLSTQRHALPREARRLRTKTLGASANATSELHLLPALLAGGRARRVATPTGRQLAQMGASERREHAADETSLTVLAPDAREQAPDWARALTAAHGSKSGRGQRPAEEEDEDEPTTKGKPVIEGKLEARLKRSSPSGSVRSSLSKSGARKLVVRNHWRLRGGASGATLIKRPNLGTCVGKLSLLRLRSAAKQKQRRGERASPAATPSQLDEEPAEEEPVELGAREEPAAAAARPESPAAARPRAAPVAAGRRHERLVREQQTSAARAPNGAQLRLTRPLAALADESQLYAIPQKTSKPNDKQKQQQQAAPHEEAVERAAEEPEGGPPVTTAGHAPQASDEAGQAETKRASSSGPALTSSGASSSGSSASSSSSSAERRHAASSDSSSPASSSAIASSSDDCIESLAARNGARRTAAPAGAATPRAASPNKPAVVGVRVDRDLYASAPGYSEPRDAAKPCLCPSEQNAKQAPRSKPLEAQDDADRIAQEPAAHAEQAEPKTTSRLRQLLHLESGKSQVRKNSSRQPEPPASETKEAGAEEKPCEKLPGGYYAYSPVVQSSSELRAAAAAVAATTAHAHGSDLKTAGSKKSWFKARFSLSSAAASQQQQAGHTHAAEQEACPREAVARNELAAVCEPRGFLGPPERRAELITISGSQLEAAAGQAQEAEHNKEALIRPKSALSATSADLIAAQRSLATAAAAKANRDRLSRQLDQRPPPAGCPALGPKATPTAGVLTVKTSEPAFNWVSARQLANFEGQLAPLVAHQHQAAYALHQRSGTNSAGMSDSSPSNNGADSDNSLQTSTGSAHTDTTATGAQAHAKETAGAKQAESPNPLGILSRILQDNKSLGYAQRRREPNASADSSGSATLRGGSSVSSLSPKREEPEEGEPKQLRQLASSRSRRPIVLTRSNISSSSDETQLEPQDAHKAQEEAQPPPLPAKGFLRAAQPANGLPRVASFTQLAELKQQPLCDFHALSSASNQEALEASKQLAAAAGYAAGARRGSVGQQQELRCLQPRLNSALNYEPFQLALSAEQHQLHYAGHQAPLANFHHNHQDLGHPNDFLYPYAAGFHAPFASARFLAAESAADGRRAALNGHQTSGLEHKLDFLAQRYNNKQPPANELFANRQPLRPKSSLDTILFASSAHADHAHLRLKPSPRPPEQLVAASSLQGAHHFQRLQPAGGCAAHQSAALKSSRQLESALYLNGAGLANLNQQRPAPAYYSYAPHYLYSQENSIYASELAASNFAGSHLTVLPTAQTTVSSSASSSPLIKQQSAPLVNGTGNANGNAGGGKSNGSSVRNGSAQEAAAGGVKAALCKPTAENSWTSAPFRSLVQINQGALTGKSNQSSAGGAVGGARVRQSENGSTAQAELGANKSNCSQSARISPSNRQTSQVLIGANKLAAELQPVVGREALEPKLRAEEEDEEENCGASLVL